MIGPARWLAGLAMVAGVAAGSYGLLRIGLYGWTIFVVVPVLVGAITSWAARPRSGEQAAGYGAISMVVMSSATLLAGWEGLICILMALPLAAPLGALGGWLAWKAASSRLAGRGVALLLILPPASVTWDAKAPPNLFEVRSAIEIAASPEEVWKHIVTFSDLPEPREWFFRAGVAYPQRARIEGSGAGAVRYCEFSTGAFVEPIEVWNEARLLRFRVTENPPPLNEWSPYAHLLPKHLHGYLVSRRGQFQLTRLANGHTLLAGTTWYQHGLWPAEYWRWWSDAIIHRIHMRVLTHIKMLAESQPN